MMDTKRLHQTVCALLMLVMLESAVGMSIDHAKLIILPKAYESNKIKAALDESFSLSCITENEQTSPNSLKWISPNNEPIETISTSTSIDFAANKRVYTTLKKNQLSVEFEKLIPADAGIYTCVAIQDGLPIEVKIELVLEKKISFYETPLQQFIKGGTDQVVSCRASSIPGPEISWFRKGIYIELKNDNKYQIVNEGLTIKNAQPEDEGIYVCRATVTSTGEVKRADIDVQVMSEPKWITKPTDTDAVKDQDVVIKCEAFAKPAPTYKWLRDGVQLAGSRYVITTNSLRIIGLTRYDTGTYTCIAENNSGHIQANFRLNVLVGPVIALMDDVHVVEGNKAVLKCVVQEAYPKAIIKWRYADSQEYLVPGEDSMFEIHDDSNAEHRNEDGNLIGSVSELIIDRASRVNRRNFTCVASNKASVNERQVQLLVEYKPTLLLNLESREIYYSWLFTDNYGTSGSESSQPSRSYPVVLTCMADGEPKPTITWFFKTIRIKHDNVKYRLIRDEPGLSKLEVNPKSLEDFGDYQCNAENRHGFEQRNLQLRQATPPRFAPFMILKAVHPDMVVFDLKPSDAPDADGGMPIEAYKIQWRFLTSDWSDANQKEVPVDVNSLDHLTEPLRNLYNVEVGTLLPDTEYLFRVAAINKPGHGVWSPKELKVKTSPRRQPDPVRLISKEDCQASSRCYIEWVVDSSGGSPVREYLIRWRRISYKDSTNQHINTDKIGPWSATVSVKAPLSNHELINLQPDSFYEVEILARNDIGPSASQPFRIRTLPGQLGEAEEYRKRDALKINKAIIIAGSIIGALILFLVLDLVLLMKSNRGLLALITKSCSKNEKASAIEYKTNKSTSQSKLSQHQTKANGSKTPYQPIKQTDDTLTTPGAASTANTTSAAAATAAISNNANHLNNNVSVPMND